LFDESGISLLPVTRRTWSPKGTTPILRHRCNWRGWPSSDQHQPALAATIRVAMDFHTWQCLVVSGAGPSRQRSSLP
jgi:hypothetical protein